MKKRLIILLLTAASAAQAQHPADTDGGRYGYRYNSWSTLNRQTAADDLTQIQSFDEHAHNEWAAINSTYIIDTLTTMNCRYQYGQAHSNALLDYDNAVRPIDNFSGLTGTGAPGPSGSNPIHHFFSTAQ